LFSYNFITTKRKIDYFDLFPKSSHGGFIAKGGFFVNYTKKEGNFKFKPYDNFQYLFDHENSFEESGASCLSTHVKKSIQRVIRNDIGFNLEMFADQKNRPFIDLAYVYEYRWGGKKYSLRFINTDVNFSVQGAEPSRNFIKYALGLIGSKKNWDYRFNFEGMYSQRLQEAGISDSLSKKF
jgi:outer membrane autotransporter protein